MAGRPTKLTEALLNDVCTAARTGAPLPDVMTAYGVDPDTARRWIRRGHERPGSIYGRFAEQVQRALAEGVVLNTATVARAGRQTSTTVTEMTKLVPDGQGGLTVKEVTRTRTTTPPDPRWAAWLLERRAKGFRQNSTQEVIVGQIPREMMGRTIAERLRVLKGGDPADAAASFLPQGDDEAKELFAG